jgi:hypothetical protein
LGRRFFRSGWNLFDFIIVGIALVPAAQGLSVLRALRILQGAAHPVGCPSRCAAWSKG